MGKSSQRKGRDGERELRDRLKEYGFDVECVEKLNVSEAMRQAVRDSERFRDGMPALFHRRNRQPWLVTVKLEDFMRMYQTAAECGAATSDGTGVYENTSET